MSDIKKRRPRLAVPFTDLVAYQRTEIKKLAVKLRQDGLTFAQIALEIRKKYHAVVSPQAIRGWIHLPKKRQRGKLHLSLMDSAEAIMELDEVYKDIDEALDHLTPAQKIAKLAAMQLERRHKIMAVTDAMIEAKVATARGDKGFNPADRADLKLLLQVSQVLSVGLTDTMKAAEYISTTEEQKDEGDILGLMDSKQSEKKDESDVLDVETYFVK